MVSFIAVLRIMQAFTEVRKMLLYPKSSTIYSIQVPLCSGALCCLACISIPLFSFQGAVKRVTLAGVQSVDRCGICVPSKLNNVSGEGLT